MSTRNRCIPLVASTILGLLMFGGIYPTFAQKKAAPRLELFFTKGFNDVAWQKATFEKVGKVWVATNPPTVGKKTVVIATVGRDGKVLDTKINMQSGSESWDKAAVEAVKNASPLPVIPKSWGPTTLEVHFHFEYLLP